MKNDKTAAIAAINKFKSTEELSAAYAALEREFTKRCQLIKELQARLDGVTSSKAPAESSEEIDVGNVIDRSPFDPDFEANGEGGMQAPEKEVSVRDTEFTIDKCEPAAEIPDVPPAPDASIVAVAVSTAERVPQSEAVATMPTVDRVLPAAAVAADDDVSAGEIIDEVAARADELSDALSLIPEVMEACIARYKKRLMGAGGFAAPRGAAVVVPVKRPKTLSDAKRIADEMLK